MKLTTIVLVLLSAFLQAGGQPVTVPIQNPSFEQIALPFYSTKCGLSSNQIPGWQVKTRSGWSATILQPTGCSIPTPPDGFNVVYNGFSTLIQDLGVKASYYQPDAYDGLYVMRLHVGNYLGPYPGYYEAKLGLGTTDSVTHVTTMTAELCSADGWAVAKFTEIPLVCPSPGYLMHYNNFGFNGNNNLVISLTMNGGWQLLFDNVSLTFEAH